MIEPIPESTATCFDVKSQRKSVFEGWAKGSGEALLLSATPTIHVSRLARFMYRTMALSSFVCAHVRKARVAIRSPCRRKPRTAEATCQGRDP
jgi:hypothetical protein